MSRLLHVVPSPNPEDDLESDFLDAEDAAEMLGLTEPQLYALMAIGEIPAVAIEPVPWIGWSDGKLLWSEAWIDKYVEAHGKPDWDNFNLLIRMTIAGVAHFVLADPDQGPSLPGMPWKFVERDWPRPVCGKQYRPDMWRGRSGRFWELEKAATTSRMCKVCEQELS